MKKVTLCLALVAIAALTTGVTLTGLLAQDRHSFNQQQGTVTSNTSQPPATTSQQPPVTQNNSRSSFNSQQSTNPSSRVTSNSQRAATTTFQGQGLSTQNTRFGTTTQLPSNTNVTQFSQQARFPQSTGSMTTTQHSMPTFSQNVTGFGRSGKDHQMLQKTQAAKRAMMRAENDDEKRQASQELRKVIEDHFDMRLKHREDELAKLEEKLNKLRAELDKRRAAKSEIVNLRWQTIVNEVNGLGF